MKDDEEENGREEECIAEEDKVLPQVCVCMDQEYQSSFNSNCNRFTLCYL